MQKAKCLFNFPGLRLGPLHRSGAALKDREASAKVRKFLYSTFGLGKIVLRAQGPACNKVDEQWFPRNVEVPGLENPHAAKAWSTQC